MMRLATTLRAARKPKGKARKAASTVPRKAMAIVSNRAFTKMMARVQEPGSGGSISTTKLPRLPKPASTRQSVVSSVLSP